MVFRDQPLTWASALCSQVSGTLASSLLASALPGLCFGHTFSQAFPQALSFPRVPADSSQSWSCTCALEPSGPSALWSPQGPPPRRLDFSWPPQALSASRGYSRLRRTEAGAEEPCSQLGRPLVPSGTSIPPPPTSSTSQTSPISDFSHPKQSLSGTVCPGRPYRAGCSISPSSLHLRPSPPDLRQLRPSEF